MEWNDLACKQTWLTHGLHKKKVAGVDLIVCLPSDEQMFRKQHYKEFRSKNKTETDVTIFLAQYSRDVPRPAHEKATVTQFLSESNFVIEAYS